MKIVFKEDDLDKRDRIINAALKEFSKNDFDKASTNNIVKEAKVSKGLLYHYFTSKQELYDFLFDFVFSSVLNAVNEKINWQQSDFFVRMREIVIIKMNLTNDYPDIYNFAMKLIRTFSFDKMQELSKNYSVDTLQRVYHENIDYSLFKEGINLEKALMIIQWTFEKYSETLAYRDHLDNDQILKELDDYINILKTTFYK